MDKNTSARCSVCGRYMRLRECGAAWYLCHEHREWGHLLHSVSVSTARKILEAVREGRVARRVEVLP
jgi:hypothetical protein